MTLSNSLLAESFKLCLVFLGQAVLSSGVVSREMWTGLHLDK